MPWRDQLGKPVPILQYLGLVAPSRARSRTVRPRALRTPQRAKCGVPHISNCMVQSKLVDSAMWRVLSILPVSHIIADHVGRCGTLLPFSPVGYLSDHFWHPRAQRHVTNRFAVHETSIRVIFGAWGTKIEELVDLVLRCAFLKLE